MNESDLRRSFENTCTDSLVTAFDDEALLICDQGNEMARTKVYLVELVALEWHSILILISINLITFIISIIFIKSIGNFMVKLQGIFDSSPMYFDFDLLLSIAFSFYAQCHTSLNFFRNNVRTIRQFCK